MKKFLIVAHYSRFLVQFELSDVRILQDMGYEVHYATNYKGEGMHLHAEEIIRAHGVVLHQIDFDRSPFNIFATRKAYRQLVELMRRENFSGLHCHTPTAGALARLAAQSVGLKPVLYTAHGFHFFKGCPLKNRLIYETAERLLARYTDALITINREDFQAAQSFCPRGSAYQVNGIGVDIARIQRVEASREALRREADIPQDAFVLFSIGELIPRKNHISAIRAFASANIPNSYYLICGGGKLMEELQREIDRLGLTGRVRLLGYCENAYSLLRIADVFCFPSYQEGLPVALMEAMAAGLPCIASRIRGNVDLMPESQFLFAPDNVDTLSQFILRCAHEDMSLEVENNARNLVPFGINAVAEQMREIYSTQLGQQ